MVPGVYAPSSSGRVRESGDLRGGGVGVDGLKYGIPELDRDPRCARLELVHDILHFFGSALFGIPVCVEAHRRERAVAT